MDVIQTLLERLRPLVGLNSWDYCVLWKLGEDQRFIEWVGCCCGGAEETQNNGGEELLFPVSPLHACRDLMYQHPRTKICNMLAHMPSSMPLDSSGTTHAQILISNQPRWINLPNCSNNSIAISDESIGTNVLIPMSGGLIELFVAKHVPEDPHIIEFVMAQCNVSWEQEAATNTSMDSASLHHQSMLGQELDGSSMAPFDHQSKTSKASGYQFQPSDNLNLPWDLTIDQIRCISISSPTNVFGGLGVGHQFPQSSENRPNHDNIFEGSTDSVMSDKAIMGFNSSGENGYSEIAAIHQSLMSSTTTNNFHPSSIEYSVVTTKDSVKQETGQVDSISDCSDQNEDDADHKVMGRAGRGHKSKNLVAERKRRKKLNDRLYSLRALVPKITKMDRASILGDAIEFVKELQKQVKDLQDELEEPPEEDGDKNSNGIQLEIPNQNGLNYGVNDQSINGSSIIDNAPKCSSNGKISDPSKQSHDTSIGDDKAQQMEVQVEVTQIDGNGFFLKVFCEHKPGGFVRLMEAVNSLGLEVTNANVTAFRGLVLNVFKVEKRNNEMVQADHVRDSLLELTRDPIGGFVKASENGSSLNYQNHNHQNPHMHSHLHSLHLQPHQLK